MSNKLIKAPTISFGNQGFDMKKSDQSTINSAPIQWNIHMYNTD